MSRRLLRHPLGWLATGLGSGLAPVAPGTAGSIASLIPAWYLLDQPLLWLLLWCLLLPLGVWSGGWANRQLNSHDSGCIVIDEWAGQWLTLLPSVWLWPNWFALPQHAIAGFLLALVLFRVTDIVKPWPASWADGKVHGGLGVMLDDLLAAVWSAILMLICLWLWQTYR